MPLSRKKETRTRWKLPIYPSTFSPREMVYIHTTKQC